MTTQEAASADVFATFEEKLKQTLAEGRVDVPMLPEVANKAMTLSSDPDSNAAEMAMLIQGDQSLAAHVMRIANSVAYTPMSNLVSLQQAISRLGMLVISEISMVAVVSAKLFNTPGFEDYVAQNWRHAIATSLWAKEIARHCRSNVEVAFLAGLLHSVGVPAVLQMILDTAHEEDVTLSTEQVHALEAKFVDEARDLVIKGWNMPEQVLKAMDTYDEADYNLPTAKLAAVVQAAVGFASYMVDEDELDPQALEGLSVLAALNLYQDDVHTLLGKTEQIEGRLQGMQS
jgi:HD-like signal output (HDOD) protein